MTSPVLRVRGRALPTGDYVDLYADGDRWTSEPVAGAEVVVEGWALPGLVEGAPADALVYDGDPRADLKQLDAPNAVILRGRLVRRGSPS